jgi:hypothetical protein
MMPPPPHSGAPPARKGLPPLAWAGIGCGSLALLAAIAGALLVGTCAKKSIKVVSQLSANPGKAAAENMVAHHPDLSQVAMDDAAGQMTLRLKDSGETIALNYAEIAQGKIPFKDAAGTLLPPGPGDLSKIPTWVPRYPGTTDDHAVFHTDDPSRTLGIISARTTDSSEDISKFFENEATKLSLNFPVRTSMNFNDSITLHLAFRKGKREFIVYAFGKSGDPLVIQTTYKETK